MPTSVSSAVVPALTNNALTVLKKRYLKKSLQGEPMEAPSDMFRRVAQVIAGAEALFNPAADTEPLAETFYRLMTNLEFLPNSPTLMNAGRELGQLSACFVLPVGDSIDDIFDAVKFTALIHKSGGGCIAGDARVWSTFCGVEPIEVLFNRTTAAGRGGIRQGNGTAYDVRDLNIRTLSMDPANGKTGLRPVTHVWRFDVPAESQLVVTTREGTVVQTSDWHPFMVLRGTSLTEVRADELQAGDILLGPERPDAFWPWDQPRTVGSLKIDAGLGWLIGFTLGDGSFGYSPALGQRRARWYSGTNDVLERVQAVLAGHGIRVKIQRDARGLLQVVTANQCFVNDLLAACGLKGPGPKDDVIRVPEIIGKSPLDVVRAFVAGLLDSDGYVAPDGSPSYSTVSRDMADDLAALMSLLGYQPTVTSKAPRGRGKRTTYNIQLCPLPQVNDLSGELATHLVNVARKCRLRSDSRKQTALAMPFSVWRDAFAAMGLVKRCGDKTGGRGPCADELNRWSCNAAGRCRRDDLRAIAAHAEPHDPKLAFLLDRVAASGQEVESVSRAADPKPFYDLSVEGWNTYAAGSRGLTMIHNTGFSFSRLRPANDVVMSTTGISSGPISFMRVFDLATETIKQGGTRRGANMGILRVDHPDILDFIRSKSDLKCFNNFNISVGLTEAFMRAVEDDGEYELINPRSRAVAARLKAREVFRSIVHQAWATGEPGIVFLDRLNRDNPTPQVGEIESTNPCVTADTFVQTTEGPRQVRDLVGRPFVAVVGGVPYPSGAQGFFATGTKPVLRLRTREGHSLRLTGDHPVRRAASVTRARVVEEWVPAAQLAPGDRIVLHRHENLCWAGKHGEAEGYLLGLLVGDGTLKADKAVISAWPARNVVNGDTTPDGIAGVMRAAAAYAETLPHRSDFAGWTEVTGRGEQRLALAEVKRVAESLGMAPGAKAVTPALEQCSSDFCRAFLRGLFDADGSVQGTTAKGVSVRLAQSDLATLEAVQRMLLRLGIASTIYRDRRPAGTSMLPNGRGGVAAYPVKAQHELVITRENIAVFAERIGFHDSAKSARLTGLLGGYRRTPNRERFLATVESLEADGHEAVYDVQVPGANAFDANGLFVHNCGEQPLLPYESCNLGSINLGRLVREGRVDWARLGEVTRLAVRFLDNVIEVNNYPLPKIDEMTRSNRKIGLGVMGWADMLISLGVAYDSPEAVALADQVMRAIREEGHAASRQLARERGSFPNYKGSIYDRPGAEPMRNATVTTIAPTGTISIIANSSSGIEPLFAVSYIRTVLDKDRLVEVNPAFERIARERGFYSVELMERIAEAGTVRGMEGVPDDVQRVFATAHDITPEVHIRMQAAFQKHTDNAVSKTVNFPAEAAEGDVDKVFRLAYELDCKGVTIYRDGSREDQVLSTAKKHEAPTLPGVVAAPEAPRAPAIRNRPKALRGATYQMDTGCGPLYVTINEDDEGIFELFTTMGKAGGCASSQCEAIGRMVSLAWRSGVEAGPVIKQLVGISCHQPAGFGVEKVLSCADAVAKAIERHCGEGGGVKKRALDRGACPDCGGTVEHLEGCVVCRGCGYSECA